MSAGEPSQSDPLSTENGGNAHPGGDAHPSDSTLSAPAFPAPLVPRESNRFSLPTLAVGQTIGDYEILRLLGSGGFARVYLAREIPLDRLVALKVSANQGSEARTLARFDHRHIVRVFADTTEPKRNLRLLSMQFIPGVTLGQLIDALGKRPASSRAAPLSWNCSMRCAPNRRPSISAGSRTGLSSRPAVPRNSPAGSVHDSPSAGPRP